MLTTSSGRTTPPSADEEPDSLGGAAKREVALERIGLDRGEPLDPLDVGKVLGEALLRREVQPGAVRRHERESSRWNDNGRFQTGVM